METIKQRQTAETIRRHFTVVMRDKGSYIFGAEPFVTVTKVIITPDLSLAKIYLSIYNVDNKDEVLEKIRESAHVLKSGLAARIRNQVRRIPQLSYYTDETVDEMYRIDSMFDDLKDNDSDK